MYLMRRFVEFVSIYCVGSLNQHGIVIPGHAISYVSFIKTRLHRLTQSVQRLERKSLWRRSEVLALPCKRREMLALRVAPGHPH